ncbi:MAG: hypothetical protein ACTSPB_18430 [Candidatus Thorarchaeota archaeon]
MPQKPYRELTGTEKASLFIATDVYAFPLADPEVAIDYQGMSGTLTLPLYIDLVNASTMNYYFKLEAQVLSGSPSSWGGLTVPIGTINASKAEKFLWEPTRTVPSAKTTETLRLTIKAFEDDSETNLIGEDYVDFTYYFFSHTEGTIINYTDFETELGWGKNFGPELKSEYPYTGAWSLKVTETGRSTWVTDSSGQIIADKSYYLSKTFDFSSYSEVFIVFHVTRTYANPNYGNLQEPPVLRVWTDSSDSIIRIPQPLRQYKPYRVAAKIPTDVTKIYWTTLMSSDNYYSYVDTIIVVGF